MGRPKKSAPVPVEPEEESQEIPEEEPEVEEDEGPVAGGKPAISKAEAVRDALAHGNDSPEDGTGYLKSIHGIDMTRQMFSSYKAQEKARQAKKVGGKPPAKGASPAPRKRAASPAAEPAQAASPPKSLPKGEPDLIESLETLKPLIASMGAEKVKRLVDLLG